MLSCFSFQVLIASRIKWMNVKKVNTFQGVWSIPAWDAHLRWHLVIMMIMIIMIVLSHMFIWRLFSDQLISLLLWSYRVAYYWSDPERWLGSAGVGRLVSQPATIWLNNFYAIDMRLCFITTCNNIMKICFFHDHLMIFRSVPVTAELQGLATIGEKTGELKMTIDYTSFVEVGFPLSGFLRWRWLWFIMRPASKVSVQSGNFWDTK